MTDPFNYAIPRLESLCYFDNTRELHVRVLGSGPEGPNIFVLRFDADTGQIAWIDQLDAYGEVVAGWKPVPF